MLDRLIKTFRRFYNKVVHGIGFIPAIMGIAFLALAMIMLELDSAGFGLRLNEESKWLTLKDAETARTIVATVCAGILSLTVFTFSMMVIVMNQAASQMSNRMLDSIIGDKRQKLTLGFFIGTIVFALFLLINISKTQETLQVPSLSVYLLLFLAVVDIFLFIYFLDFITQSFRFEQLIQRIHKSTVKSFPVQTEHPATDTRNMLKHRLLMSRNSGFFQGFNKERLLKLAVRNNIVIEILHHKGAYVLQGTPLFKIYGELPAQQLDSVFEQIDFYFQQEIDKNFYYGFFHLTEVAIKALSPGINDPGTAVLTIGTLTDLFGKLLRDPVDDVIRCRNGVVRIIVNNWTFEELFCQTMLHIWHYGAKEPSVQQAFNRSIQQLIYISKDPVVTTFLNRLINDQLVTAKE